MGHRRPRPEVYIGTNIPAPATPEYVTNIAAPAPWGGQACIDAIYVELLARDTSDFADDVPRIPWEDFRKLSHAPDL